ncbi:MAG: HAMP domain-containing sensor histidine kinase [Desulfobacteraceae bacterium]
MKRLKILILLFLLAVSLPLAYVAWQSYQSLTQEEKAQLRFFGEAMLDEMEKELAGLVDREENRAVDEYHATLDRGSNGLQKSPLSDPPKEGYILGYLQNNPDGSFQSPLVPDLGRVPQDQRALVLRLKDTNTIFNRKKFEIPEKQAAPEPESRVKEAAELKKKKDLFADRYLSKQQDREQRSFLGSQTVRKEKITPRQAMNIYKEKRFQGKSGEVSEQDAAAPAAATAEAERPADRLRQNMDAGRAVAPSPLPPLEDTSGYQVEVAPLQSIFISQGRYFIFRRIALNNQIYRQGFVLEADAFLRHLAAAHFDPQPMAGFTGLRLQIRENGRQREILFAGVRSKRAENITHRTFPAPFDFISAALTATAIPPSPARKTLGIALWVLGFFMMAGLVAIYKSARAVVDLSERRSQFVSSVTHELKTPLTNIRMYVEMLEQGIAATPEREQEYFQVLGSESARLSRLINNVLELSKLEKKQRPFDLRKDRLDGVLTEVRTVMAHKLEQEGFTLDIEPGNLDEFAYDREVMVQVLINLIENSIKFGAGHPEKRITIATSAHDGWACVAVSDTGPGIPRSSLKKIFDDFYRVDNKLTRATGGTGIGLALVKKFIVAMGGRVEAANNPDAGCTITLRLPLEI